MLLILMNRYEMSHKFVLDKEKQRYSDSHLTVKRHKESCIIKSISMQVFDTMHFEGQLYIYNISNNSVALYKLPFQFN